MILIGLIIGIIVGACAVIFICALATPEKDIWWREEKGSPPLQKDQEPKTNQNHTQDGN